MKKRFLFLIIAVVLSFSLVFVACGDPAHTHIDADNDGKCDTCGEMIGTTVPTPDNPSGDDPSGDDPSGEDPSAPIKAVDKIAVQAKPTISEYVVGDEFSLEGGTLLVTYKDDTTEVIAMTATGVEVTPPGLSTAGTKQVKIEYGGKSCRFTVKVVSQSFSVAFNENYDGAGDATVKTILKGKTVSAPNVTREGYTLYGWYETLDYIEKFDFDTTITSDVTLYALWVHSGSTYNDVTFDYDFYGARITQYSYPVISGGKASRPSADPVRTGYAFNGWVDASGAEFDFDSAISSAITITATWTKTVTGKNDYTFEAEDTDLTGKTGPALSGQAVETGMIVSIADRNASNGRCVSYLYRNGLSLEFNFASDIEVADATIQISLSAEYMDYTYSPDNYGVYLNSVPIHYSAITFSNVPPADDNKVDCLDFQYYTMGANLTIRKGANSITLVTENSVPVHGTTLTAVAPMVDAVKINTTAVLTWDGSKGLPMDNY